MCLQGLTRPTAQHGCDPEAQNATKHLKNELNEKRKAQPHSPRGSFTLVETKARHVFFVNLID